MSDPPSKPYADIPRPPTLKTLLHDHYRDQLEQLEEAYKKGQIGFGAFAALVFSLGQEFEIAKAMQSGKPHVQEDVDIRISRCMSNEREKIQARLHAIDKSETERFLEAKARLVEYDKRSAYPGQDRDPSFRYDITRYYACSRCSSQEFIKAPDTPTRCASCGEEVLQDIAAKVKDPR